MSPPVLSLFFFFFFFNDTATTEIYTLSLHDALPILEPLGASRFPKCDSILYTNVVWIYLDYHRYYWPPDRRRRAKRGDEDVFLCEAACGIVPVSGHGGKSAGAAGPECIDQRATGAVHRRQRVGNERKIRFRPYHR